MLILLYKKKKRLIYELLRTSISMMYDEQIDQLLQLLYFLAISDHHPKNIRSFGAVII